MTTFSDTSAAQLAYIEESVYGTTPASGNGKYLRMTGESLGFDYTMETSKEINSTAQVPDAVVVDTTAGGGINIELSYREYDPFIEALLRSTFDTYGTGGISTLTVTIDKTAGTITDDGTDGFTGLDVGQYFYMAGTAASGANDGLYRVGANTNDVITVDASTPLAADETSTASVTFSSTRIATGTAALRSFSIEKSLTDVTQFFLNKGRVPSKWDLSFAPGQLLTGMFDFLGSTQARAGATGLPGTTAAAQSYGIMNCVSGVANIFVRNSGGTSLLDGASILNMNLSIDGALRGQKALGVLGNAGVGRGTFAITGTMNIYFAAGSLFDEALAQNLIELSFTASDSSGNGYGFTMPNVKCSVPKVNAGAKDQDCIMEVPFFAVAPDTATDKMIYIDRFGAAIV